MYQHLMACLLLALTLGYQAQAQEDPRLAKFLEAHPDADADQDGTLTIPEFQAYRRQQADKQPARPQLTPTHADIQYGDHERHRIDLWLPESDTPTPLMILIHGGGFSGGDKRTYAAQPQLIDTFRQAGIAVAAINYRLTDGGKNPYPAAMLDGARAIQYLRHHAAAYNLRPDRFAAGGSSAGGCMSLWLGFHPDLADPTATDPIARQSTRLTAMAVSGAQSSLHMTTLYTWFGVDSLREHPSLRPFYGLPADGPVELTDTLDATMREASPITYLSADDPPVYMTYGDSPPVTATSSPGHWVHHATLGLKLQEQMQALHLECIVSIGRKVAENPYRDPQDFIIQKLLAPTPAD